METRRQPERLQVLTEGGFRMLRQAIQAIDPAIVAQVGAGRGQVRRALPAADEKVAWGGVEQAIDPLPGDADAAGDGGGLKALGVELGHFLPACGVWLAAHQPSGAISTSRSTACRG